NTFAMLSLPQRSAGEIDHKSGVAPLLAVNCNGAAVLADNSEGNAETESSAAALASGSEERIENLVFVFGGNAHTVIKKLDSYEELRRRADSASRYLKEFRIAALFFQRAACVADHVYNYLPQPGSVGQNGWKVFFDTDIYGDTVNLELTPEERHRIVYYLPYI